MTVIYHDLEHCTNIAFMKGAPERVLDACTYDSQGNPLTTDDKDEVLRLMDRFASEGLVLPTPQTPRLISARSSIGIKVTKRRHPHPRPRRNRHGPPRSHRHLRPPARRIPRRRPRMPTCRHRGPHAHRRPHHHRHRNRKRSRHHNPLNPHPHLRHHSPRIRPHVRPGNRLVIAPAPRHRAVFPRDKSQDGQGFASTWEVDGYDGGWG